MTRINTNVSSLVAQKTLARSNDSLQESLTRLSTGLKINTGKDDPAGLIASEVLRTDITSVQRAITNSERANQLIATADSALGQVSSLLNDIRGLVSDAANTGALSQAQIDASQLQLDSSLEAIDRISQTTSFQGRRLLDGSLGFLTSGVGTADVRASGTFGTTAGVAASGTIGTAGTRASGSTGAAGTRASGTFGTVSAETQATVTLSGSATGVGNAQFNALSGGSAFNGFTVQYVRASGGSAAATYDGTNNILEISVNSASTVASVAAAVAGNASAAANIAVSAVAAGLVASATAGTTSATLSGGISINTILLSATAEGAAYTSATVTLANTAATGAETASYDTATKTLTINKNANSTTAQVISAINTDGTFSATTAGNGLGVYGATTSANVTTGGTDNNTLTLSAVNVGTTFNLTDILFQNTAATGAETASYDTATNILTVNKGANSTTAQVITAINGTGIFSASTAGAGLGVYASGTVADVTSGGTENSNLVLSAVSSGTAYNLTDITFVDNAATGSETASYNTATNTLTINKGASSTTAQVIQAVNQTGVFHASTTGAGLGVYAAGTTADVTSGGVNNNLIVLSATAGGAAYNNLRVVLSDTAATGAETATFNTGTTPTLTVYKHASSTTDQVIAAINATGVFSASTSGDGLGVYSAGTTNGVTTGGATGGAAISDLKIDQANFGTAASISVQVNIDNQATQGTLTYSGGTLTSDLILEVGGKNGFEVFNFGSGTTIDQINTALNLVSDATGVQSTVTGAGLTIRSSEYGSDSFVSARALTGTFNTSDENGNSATRETGTDVQLRINGVQATGRGLKASLNTSTLDLSFTVSSAFQNNSSFDFSITGGGATFQLGPDVVSNQQARLGIQGVSTATLGGVSGTLFELRSGGAKDLSTDVKGAAKVIDEVVSSVTSLRGRLGAFQKTTLETNVNTLNDTLETLADAESSIRDADFAAESAALTRAQILVQAGTSVLSIANQNPQSVLALLR